MLKITKTILRRLRSTESTAPTKVEAPLRVGQACSVTKAGQWISELAYVKSVHPDGTFDVACMTCVF